MNDRSRTRFLNVDLEVRATEALTELVDAFEPEAMALTCTAVQEGYFANLELTTQPIDAEAAIRSFVRLIGALPPRARELWSGAFRRDFSVGVEAGSAPSSFELALTPDVLRLAADVGARITFVVYVHARATGHPTPPSSPGAP
ncbi:MAG TPA: hypothetical protein VGM06_06480 [Polyangiaceae bacterium]|jgi:hypothetical protein